jgi:hypothetical protein
VRVAICTIQDKKPDRCKSYPTVYDLQLVVCGYKFDSNNKRTGSCNRCGECCSVPRIGGEPGAGYDPFNGIPCKHLEFEEVEE